MDNSFNSQNAFSEEESIDLKQELFKYLRYWPWFLLTLAIALGSAYIYLRFQPRIYQTSTKMKILDESAGLELPSSAFLFQKDNINLQNEIEILKSFLLLEKVAKKLNLNTRFFEEGTILTTQINALPFHYEQIVKADSITRSMSYHIKVENATFEVTNLKTDQVFSIANHNSFEASHNFPFNIKINTEKELKNSDGKTFIIHFGSLKNATLDLRFGIKIEPVGKGSDLLQLSMKGQSKERSEQILDTLMSVFDKDGIYDRQSVSQRTIDFIDARFEFLAFELDSIEVSYRNFKQKNNVVDIVTDAQIGLQQRSKSDEEVFQIETQLAIEEMLSDALRANAESELLPNNIGLASLSINVLINEYNIAILESDKFRSSAGKNNPTVKLVQSQINDLRSNITRSLNSYHQQLIVSQSQLQKRKNRFVGQVAQIPQKEKLLKAIERQQLIKQSLYLLLLTKREEAAINLAITEPSIKVVDYALSGGGPISPKPNTVYAGAILGGLLIPFGVLYLIFMLDTKLHSKEDITRINSRVPVVGEIPNVKNKEDIIFKDPNDRTALGESFRILSSNIDYILPITNDNKGKVIYCTSTIKGEGKTYISINLSLALSSINKKVLLIGGDLRNPQIHTHIKFDKNSPGLSNYLQEASFDWRSNLVKGFDEHPNHDILLSGSIPPNTASLLTNGRFKDLIDKARDLYDYIVVDTAPTIVVTDTMLNSNLADVTVYIARANYTEKKLLSFSKELSESGKLKNMAYVINGVGHNKSYGYNYGYNYGYGTKD